jgi:(R,R)-butanediol dehydrogenase/meso-butanediol dehydrogenase/diacetyl reductase
VSIWGHPATVDMQKVVLKEIDLKPFITGRIALDDLVTEGFDILINHNDTAVKILVHP